MFLTLSCYCNSSVETLQHLFGTRHRHSVVFSTVFTLMPEETFVGVTTLKKMQQNLAAMHSPGKSQVTLSKRSFLPSMFSSTLDFPQLGICTSYSLLWPTLCSSQSVKVFFTLGNLVCPVTEMKGLFMTFTVIIFLPSEGFCVSGYKKDFFLPCHSVHDAASRETGKE